MTRVAEVATPAKLSPINLCLPAFLALDMVYAYKKLDYYILTLLYNISHLNAILSVREMPECSVCRLAAGRPQIIRLQNGNRSQEKVKSPFEETA